jgi:predicted RNA-binding protein with RPS1 domain
MSFAADEPSSSDQNPSSASTDQTEVTPASTDAARPAPATNPADEHEPFPQPKLRIGSQRYGVAKMKARPQIAERKEAAESTQPEAAPAGGPQPDQPPPAARHSNALSPAAPKKFPPPNRRSALSPELQVELEQAMGGMSLDEMVEGQANPKAAPELEPEARVKGRVVSVHRGDVFIDLGGRSQGVLPLTMFSEPPQTGALVDCMVSRFDAEEGLYHLSMSGAAIEKADWSSLTEGVLVEARITGHNKGGLECEVNNIRGFIPAGQISLYRVEDLAQFVGQKMVCVATEVNPDKRNLVLSRRAVLEREKAEARSKLLSELAPGQVREGIVRSLRDFGAFVDLGGVDGLLHVSQLSWARVGHPNEVLQEGQKVTVKIHKIDPDTGKISLAMKELTESPWTNVASKYPARTKVTGKVSKLMDFGAFVQLEPGVEGLVHISELAHHRVFRVSDVVSEGQEVEAQVMSVDADKQRISLSIKAVAPRPEPAKKAEAIQPEEEAPPPPVRKSKVPLKGGIGRTSGGDHFGLKW